jgi:hypothetical protein
VPTLANEFGRLVGALHNKSPYPLITSLKHQYFQIHALLPWQAREVPSRRDYLSVLNWGGL